MVNTVRLDTENASLTVLDITYMDTPMTYQKPGFFTQNIFNPIVAFVTGTLGVSMRGSRVLAVRGRKSGEWRTTPVNPLTFEGDRYLVAPRGTTHWVRNIRESGTGELRKGRKAETIHVTEVPDAEKAPILRAYLKLWAMESGKFFGLPNADATDAEIAAIAANHPVFRISK